MTAVHRFEAHPGRPLAIAFDPEKRLLDLRPEGKIKGMFLSPLVDRLGMEWEGVRETLSEPPRFGGYIPFADYPLRDYGRLTLAAATRVHPLQPIAEAVRLIGRTNILIFAESRLGSLLSTVADTPMKFLGHLPTAVNTVVSGADLTMEKTGERAVRMRLGNQSGWTDSMYVGVFEGAIMHYRQVPRMVVEVGPGETTYEVSWSDS